MKLLLVSEGRSELGGALEIILHKLLGDFTLDRMKVSDRKLDRVHGSGRGYFKRAMEWMQFAHAQNYDAIVLVVDQGNFTNRRTELNEAQNNLRYPIPRAFCVAILEFDAWMLADEKAITRVMGRTIQRQPDPEDISDPKAHCLALCHSNSQKTGLGELYAEIATHLDLEVLTNRCPKGFAPFAKRVRALPPTP